MASTVDICNGALQLVGETFITSLSDTTEAARQCNTAFHRVRQSIIRSHAWNATTARVLLTKLATTPVFGWDFEYSLPADCLIVYDIDTPGSDAGWRVEGRKLLTDQDSQLGIIYGKDETDTTQFDSMLTEVLSLAVAVEICEALTQSNTKKQALETRLDRHMARARQADGWEQTPADFEEDPWILSRWRR